MPFYSNAHIDFVDYAKMRILIFVMKKSIYIAIALFFSTLAAFSQKDPLVGFYMGKISNQTSYPFGQSPELCLEVSRFGESYQLKLTARPLLRTDNYGSASGLKAENGKIVLKNFSSLGLSGEITPEGALLKGKNRKGNETVADLKKTTIVSPTMGMPAPEGAIVLFDGKSKSEWQHIGGEPCSWKLEDGAMVSQPLMVDGKKKDGTIYTKKKFGAVKIHLEFKIPAEYVLGETRGNSGVHFGPYEVQIIDSFGGEGNWWQCGAIYRIHAPKSNASLEPEAWQTYDIEYTPAKFVNGRLVAHPEMTVYQNGIRVQNKEPVFHPTNITQKDKPHTPDPISIGLQDHSHPVSFPNIWVQPLE